MPDRSPLSRHPRSGGGVLGPCLLALGALLFAPLTGGYAGPSAGARDDVVFTRYTALASNPELARRMLSPLAATRVAALLKSAGKALAEQPIDLAQERFLVSAPAREPPSGYGLIVFVPPWQEAKMPQGWAAALDRSGIIFATAARSGNGETDLGRRAPLALTAAANIIAQYRVDPDRIYIAGFSGGSRVAMRLALAYPDLFRGALLNAGSDPIGESAAPLPPRDLFWRFQQSSRLVYVTGELDPDGRAADANSMISMRAWCVFDVESEVMPRVGHATPDSAALARALDALGGKRRSDADRLAACRSAIEAKLKARLDEARGLIDGGKRDEAEKLLSEIDRRFGGLAAPLSVDLSRELAGPPP